MISINRERGSKTLSKTQLCTFVFVLYDYLKINHGYKVVNTIK